MAGEPSLNAIFSSWRRQEMGDREVVEGEAADRPPEEMARLLAGWPGHHYWQGRRDGRWLVLVRELAATHEHWWFHLLLLGVTFVTVSVSGAGWLAAAPDASLLTRIATGLPFAIPLLAVLGAHEAGHYLVARRYRVDASPPFFLPFPTYNLLGTLGAFVRLRSPVYDRQTLFDIAVAGPVAGLAIAVPVLAWGIARAPIVPGPGLASSHQLIVLGAERLYLGDAPILLLLRAMLGREGGVLRLGAAGVAGWAGIFLTMLNLLPLAQFDGGQIAFALLVRRQRWLAAGTLAALATLGIVWPFWWGWALFALVLGRGRLLQPRVVSARFPLDRRRAALAWAAFALLALCFVPVPVQHP